MTMTSAQIRQSFIDFFRSKEHTIVPSSSLLPDAPNLLFTNAGMNQFVPIFLGQSPCPYKPGRAADTQKCIRAGGKHNDLEDVGLDTYHHTFFEMLGNWSFGDYFKKESLEWGWELLTRVWGFPPARLYATVYKPGAGDPAEFDTEAYEIWADIFRRAGRDPAVHIVYGGKKDNFWMMGDTGPCGPCSEIHVDLTPGGDTRGALVNRGTGECIEIWNHVFIQLNAGPDGSFSPLPARHVDTGMGFERACGIIQCTRNFTDFSRPVSNYESDAFRPLFDRLERLSGKKYGSTLPAPGTAGATPQERVDVAFRVIADHIRTLSFAIADGIQPGNTDRNYVLRRILRRAVRYGRNLGLHDPFFFRLVDVLADTMGDVFPEVRARREQIEDVIRREEETFNRTLDKGLGIFDEVVRLKRAMVHVRRAVREKLQLADLIFRHPEQQLDAAAVGQLAEAAAILLEQTAGLDPMLAQRIVVRADVRQLQASLPRFLEAARAARGPDGRVAEVTPALREAAEAFRRACAGFLEVADSLEGRFNGEAAFLLYDTYGFPLDLTELMAREQGLAVDAAGFERLMAQQRALAQGARKKTVIEVSQVASDVPTAFVGFETLETAARVVDVIQVKDRTAVLLDRSPCYAEMGGQVGDTGELAAGGQVWRVADTQKAGAAWLHFLAESDAPAPGAEVVLRVDAARRAAIQRHHTVTHLFHWALHEVVSADARQQGSFVGPDKLTFDFNSAALTPAQTRDIERLVNERVVEDATVSWSELPYAEIKGRREIQQFFGEKYGDAVRVVQIGGTAGALDGFSMELCGGTHCRRTGEIGPFRIVAEGAIAAGVRRVEALAGLAAWQRTQHDLALLKAAAGRLETPVADLEKKIESMLAHQKDLVRQVRELRQKQAAEQARALAGSARTVGGVPLIAANVGEAEPDIVQAMADTLRGQFKGVIVLGGASGGSVFLVAMVPPDLTSRVQAGKIIQAIAPIVGGKGGGKPEMARGGGKDPAKLDEALARVSSLWS